MEKLQGTAKGFLVGTFAGVATGLLGFALAYGHAGMGFVVFMLVPVVSGFCIAWATKYPSTVKAAALFALVISLLILLASGKEGPLCALMALPLLAVGLVIGVLLGTLARRIIRPAWEQTTTSMLLVAAPLVIFTGQKIEQPFLEHGRIESISTTVRIPGSPDQIWPYIQSIDSIHVPKPWLMYVGLPIPQRCTLEKTAAGARRTCYFNSGYIEETVMEWDPPYSMTLRIDRTHMSGRHWLGFENASYHLQPDGNATLLTRTTTISSHLSPVWYWRPLERWGVTSEHSYILSEAARRAVAH